jgi:hypothetical protein
MYQPSMSIPAGLFVPVPGASKKTKPTDPGFRWWVLNLCQTQIFAGAINLSTLPWDKRNKRPDNNTARRLSPSGLAIALTLRLLERRRTRKAKLA